MDESLSGLRKLVMREINKIVQKGDLTLAELSAAKEAVCLLKELNEVEMEGYDEGYSERMEYRPREHSYMRGRNSRNGQYMSRDNGMSSHSIRDRAVAALESMVDTAESSYEQEEILKMIDQIRK